MRSLALANHKGGVGKTTTAIHLAHGLALRGERVVLLDLDPQGNATVALQDMEHGDELELKHSPAAPLRSVSPGLWIVASAGGADGRDVDLLGLQRLVEDLRAAGISWLIADCPPRMDQWGWAGLRLCEDVLVPVQAEFFAIHGLSQMIRTLEALSEEKQGNGNLLGVLLTLVDDREPVSREVVQDLRRNLGTKVLSSMIFRDSRLVEAASHGQTAFVYSPDSKGALCYGELVREVAHGGSSTG